MKSNKLPRLAAATILGFAGLSGYSAAVTISEEVGATQNTFQ